MGVRIPLPVQNMSNEELPIAYYSLLIILIHGVIGSTQDFDSCCSGSSPDESTKMNSQLWILLKSEFKKALCS